MSQFTEHTDRMRSLAAIAALIAMYGVAGYLGYYLGGMLGLSFSSQLMLIAVILLTFPIALLINYYWKRRAAQSSTSPKPATEQSSTTNTQTPAGDYQELTRNADEAVKWLSSSKLGNLQKGAGIYGLPWFLVAGAPASGKSSLIVSSGLNFQPLPGQRHADLGMIRPTRDCEWRIADQAVFLDTAGRYQQDEGHCDEWSALVETIKRVRKDRPIDGMIIAVDASQLLAEKETEIEQQAKVLRARLDEVIERTHIHFPVYLVFTHIDAIEGFNAFFHTFDRAARAQVWGVTFPLNQVAQAHALFDVEFDYLCDALMRHRMHQLALTGASAEQLSIFDLPINFSNTRSKLGLFVSALFRPNPFSENPLTRGFYFTGSAQTASSASAKDGNNGEGQAVGEGLFVESFFQDLLMRDRNLAASFLAKKSHPQVKRNILVAIAATLLCCFLIGLAVSMVGNERLIGEALERAGRVDEFTRANVEPNRRDPAAIQAELESAELLRETLSKLDNYHRNSPPLSLRFGLYTGNSIDPYLRTVYFESMHRIFFKTAVAGLEKDLREFTSGANSASKAANTDANEDLGRYYDLLKAYLMLANPERTEATFLNNRLSEYWQKALPPDQALLAQHQLVFYAQQADRRDVSHIKIDENLVAEARRRLAAYPATNRFFKRITSEIDTKVAPVTLDSIIQGRGHGLLNGTYAVPGSFTIEGYQNYMRKAIESAAQEMSKDDWVMGESSSTAKDQTADIGKLQGMYFREYATQWQKFVRGISVPQYKTRDDAVEALKLFSVSESPIVLVLNEVARQTNITASATRLSWWQRIFNSASDNSVIKGNEVEREFQPLFKFVANENEKEASLLSQYRAILRSVLDNLETASNDQLAQTSKLLLTGKDDIGLQKAELSTGKLLDQFKTAATGDVAGLCKRPLDNLRAMLYGGGYEQIEKSWREQVYNRAHALESGFPFKDTGEATVTDLTRFLNPVNGQLTTFFNDKLATSFEDAQGQWKLKEAGAFKFSPKFISYLNGARQLRDALFAQGGQQPEVSYEILLQPVTGADIVIEIDGARVETRGTTPQSAKFIWPARAGASGAKITVIQGSQMFEKAFPGEWGLFKMVAAGGSNNAGNQYSLSWSIGSVPVRATLRPSSAVNPFQRNLFTQLHAPESLRE